MGIFNKKTKDEDKKVEKDSKVESKVSDKKEDKKIVKSSSKKIVKKVKKSGEKTIAQRAYKVLLKPVISEKATIGVSQNKYAFVVAGNTNKIEIKKAIEEVYNVIPKSINIINTKGKNVRFGRTKGTQKDTKKAIVTLKAGDTIKLYEGI